MLLSRRIGWVLNCALYASPFFYVASAVAGITASGDVSPTNPSSWNTYTYGYIGNSAAGNITVSSNSTLVSQYGYLGYRSGATGNVTVTGASAAWTNSSDLFVGYTGTGKLRVENGGIVTTKSLYASTVDLLNSNGNGTINTNGWVTDDNLVFDSSHGLQQTITFGSSGSMNLNVTGAGVLGAGYKGVGLLSVSNGLTAASTYGYLGYNAGATGTATISGNASAWTNTSLLYVGYSGMGALTIADGGKVTASSVYLGNSAGSTGTASVTGPGSTWLSNYAFYVGYSGGGTVTIANSGQVRSAQLNLGYSTGTSGNVSVTGSGSSWTCTNNASVYVGYSGSGCLTVANGGQMNAGSAYLGNSANATGTVAVTGPGSAWTSNGDLYVGYSGTGQLRVEDDGVVTAKSLYASVGNLLNSSGNGTINANGWVADANLVFDASHGLQQSLSFGTGGTVNLNINGAGALGAGYKGTGALTVSDGLTAVSTVGYLGYNAGAAGTATVSGNGAAWSNSNNLYVGHSGVGSLTIANGGQVRNSTAYLGNNAGSTGNVTVTDLGSLWTCTNNMSLYVGNSGAGNLTIANGGQVSSRMAYIGYSSAAIGQATVTGNGSTWANNGDLYVGHSGAGRLTIANGGRVSNASAYLGYYPSATGNVSVTGLGSTWTNNGNLYVGSSGAAQLRVEDGGLVTANNLYAATSNLRNSSGLGTININGWVADENLVFDAVHGPQQSFAFGTGGTVNLTVNGAGILGAGCNGVGTLRVSDGVTVASTDGYLGYNAGSTGTAAVSGAGSIWNNSGNLYVGYAGAGVLTITTGGQVRNRDGYLGFNSSWPTASAGNVTVTGAGSTWTSSGNLVVGYSGSGALTIANGGLVTSSVSTIGYYSGEKSTGAAPNVTVTGPGSAWITAGNLTVGQYGDGRLTVANGGQVACNTGLVGYMSIGTATVTGHGSLWTNNSTLIVGNSYSTGCLTIAEGGQVTAQSLSLASSSTVNLQVSNNDMLVLGAAALAGSLANNGKINLFANTFLSAGIYTPISELKNRSLTWSGSGVCNAFGGVWDNVAKTFTVPTVTPLSAGTTGNLTAGERLLISASGQQVGLSFGTGVDGKSLSADLMTQLQLDSLKNLLPADQTVLSGWNFTTDLSGSSVLLTYNVGTGLTNLGVWHYDGSTWTSFAANDLLYASDGRVSFTVSGFSGYALSGSPVPEPATLALVALGVLPLLKTRRRHACRSAPA